MMKKPMSPLNQREQANILAIGIKVVLTPAILLILIVCIGFIIMAERKREIYLPRLEGSWSKEENVIITELLLATL